MDKVGFHSCLHPFQTPCAPCIPSISWPCWQPGLAHLHGLRGGKLVRTELARMPKICSKSHITVRAGQRSVAQEQEKSEILVKHAKSLEEVRVFGLNGNSIPVANLWKDRKVVVGFTRHFGCILCMKRANLLSSRKAEMDAAGVGLIIIGPGNAEQAQGFVKNTKFPGEVYADPTYSTYKIFEFVSGVGTTITPMTGIRVISAYLDGYRQDWGLSFQKDTVVNGGWQQGGVIVAGPGSDFISFLFKDDKAGDEPNMDDVIAACCAV